MLAYRKSCGERNGRLWPPRRTRSPKAICKNQVPGSAEPLLSRGLRQGAKTGCESGVRVQVPPQAYAKLVSGEVALKEHNPQASHPVVYGSQ